MENVKNIVEVKNIKKLILVFAGTALLTLSAKIQTPLSPVPATMQTFAVLFLGILFGPKLAFLTVLLYLFEGLIGIPVFAKGGGYIYFTGPTSGYLFGFLLAAYFAGKTIEQTQSVENDLHKEEHPSMTIQQERQSRVTFGGKKS